MPFTLFALVQLIDSATDQIIDTVFPPNVKGLASVRIDRHPLSAHSKCTEFPSDFRPRIRNRKDTHR
jgi:hypothetical protein